jgi:hypothetical protein
MSQPNLNNGKPVAVGTPNVFILLLGFGFVNSAISFSEKPS